MVAVCFRSAVPLSYRRFNSIVFMTAVEPPIEGHLSLKDTPSWYMTLMDDFN